MNEKNPEIWGPNYWFSYHTFASSYPLRPSKAEMNIARLLIKIIPFTLLCESCSDHAFTYIKNSIRKDPSFLSIVGHRFTLENFFIDFHNSVNLRLNKPLLTYKDAKQKWNNTAIDQSILISNYLTYASVYPQNPTSIVKKVANIYIMIIPYLFRENETKLNFVLKTTNFEQVLSSKQNLEIFFLNFFNTYFTH